MISPDTFYELPEEEQRELVRSGHVVQSREIIDEIPSPGEPVRVFEHSIDEKIAKLLKQGQYTVDDIVEEFQLNTEDVRARVYALRDNPVETLETHHAILRVRGQDGPSYNYTLEAIPFHARVADPTLGFSLLQLAESEELPEGTECSTLESGTYEDEYLDVICDYWGLNYEEAAEYLQEFEREYISSNLGPLPIISAPDREQAVRDRLANAEEGYTRKRFDTDTVRKRLSKWEHRCRKNPSIPVFQAAAVELFDIKRYAVYEDNVELRKAVQKSADSFLSWLQVSELSSSPATDEVEQETETVDNTNDVEATGDNGTTTPTTSTTSVDEPGAELTGPAREHLRTLVELGETTRAELQRELGFDRTEDIEVILSILEDYHKMRDDDMIVPNNLAIEAVDAKSGNETSKVNSGADTVQSRVKELSNDERSRLRDIAILQPTKNSELMEAWGMETGSEVHSYLEEHFADLYYRDENGLIRAIDDLESVFTETREEESETDKSLLGRLLSSLRN